MSPEPGWYADPGDPNQRRWWDGHQWSHATEPLPALVGHGAPGTPMLAVPPQPVAAPSWVVQPVLTPVVYAVPEMPTCGVGERLVAHLLDTLLILITLGIGWIVWAAVLAPEGQTPARKLLNQRVVDITTNQPVGFARMFFARGLLGGFVFSSAFSLSCGLVMLVPLFERRNRTIFDLVSSTVVVPDTANAR